MVFIVRLLNPMGLPGANMVGLMSIPSNLPFKAETWCFLFGLFQAILITQSMFNLVMVENALVKLVPAMLVQMFTNCVPLPSLGMHLV